MFNIDISRPACANAISLSATKNPCLVKKPLAVGSDKSQIFKKVKKKLQYIYFNFITGGTYRYFLSLKCIQ